MDLTNFATRKGAVKAALAQCSYNSRSQKAIKTHVVDFLTRHTGLTAVTAEPMPSWICPETCVSVVHISGHLGFRSTNALAEEWLFVHIWLGDRTYPVHPPSVIIEPLPRTTLSSGHPHCGDNGFVYLHALHSWSERSTLDAIVHEMATISATMPFCVPVQTHPAMQHALPPVAASPAHPSVALQADSLVAPRSDNSAPAGSRDMTRTDDDAQVHELREQLRAAELNHASSQSQLVQVLHSLDSERRRSSARADREVPEELLDPISFEIMSDPVICADGHSYDRPSIEAWLRNHDTSPRTGMKLPHKQCIPNHQLRKLIEAHLADRTT